MSAADSSDENISDSWRNLSSSPAADYWSFASHAVSSFLGSEEEVIDNHGFCSCLNSHRLIHVHYSNDEEVMPV